MSKCSRFPNKLSFKTQQSANKMGLQLVANGKAKHARAYACHYCGFYHLTSMSKRTHWETKVRAAEDRKSPTNPSTVGE
jgi:hypothetical protein